MSPFWTSRPVKKLLRDRWAIACCAIIVCYALVAIAVKLGVGPFGIEPDARVGPNYTSPSGDSWLTWLGTDRQGRSIFYRMVFSAKIALGVGFVCSLIGVIVGGLLGAIAGYFGRTIDAVVVWLYSTLQSVPYLLLLIGVSYAAGRGLTGIYAAFIATFWVGPCRVVRGEVMKLRDAEYVQAARCIGAGRARILLRYIIPNTMHLLLVNFALLFVGAIKSEVILSFLGLGVQGEPSWGIMINQSRSEVVNGFYWQIGAATFAMFALVLAFNIFADALQDALDPKSL